MSKKNLHFFDFLLLKFGHSILTFSTQFSFFRLSLYLYQVRRYSKKSILGKPLKNADFSPFSNGVFKPSWWTLVDRLSQKSEDCLGVVTLYVVSLRICGFKVQMQFPTQIFISTFFLGQDLFYKIQFGKQKLLFYYLIFLENVVPINNFDTYCFDL